MKNNLILSIWFSLIFPAFSFESDFISVEAEGNESGADLILIHGFSCSPKVWSEFVHEVQSEFHIHLVQVAGFADSTAPKKHPESYLETTRDEISRYIEEKKIEQPTLIGHSMGGLLSLLAASQETSKVEKVIVVDALPFYSLLFNPLATTEMVLPQAQAMKKQLLALDEKQFEHQAKNAILPLTKDDTKRDLLLKWSKESDRTVYADYLKELISYDARPTLKEISCPVTVIHAYDETVPIPQEQLSQLYTTAYTNLEGVSIKIIPESYHFIMWDQPEHFLSTVREALGTVPTK